MGMQSCFHKQYGFKLKSRKKRTKKIHSCSDIRTAVSLFSTREERESSLLAPRSSLIICV